MHNLRFQERLTVLGRNNTKAKNKGISKEYYIL
jgi:hypothetical protein